MKKNTRIIRNHHQESYLIGDSISEGKDQVISRTIKYGDLYDEQNERVINEARDIARKGGFDNIRLVTVTFYGVFLRSVGFIEYKTQKQTIKIFKL